MRDSCNSCSVHCVYGGNPLIARRWLGIDRYKMVIVYEHESKMFLDKNGFSLQASMQRKPARMPTKGPLKDMLNCWRSCWFTLSVNLLERQQKICKKICLIAGVLAGLR